MFNLRRKIFLFLLLAVFFSLILSLSRQILIHRRVTRSLADKKEELRTLKKQNQELKERLEEVKSRQFLEEQVRTILGLDSPKITVLPTPPASLELTAPKISYFEKWRRLFIY